MEKDLKYCLAINTSLRIGAQRFQKILAYFGSCQKAWEAPYYKLRRAGLDAETSQELQKIKKKIVPQKEFEQMIAENIKVISSNDKTYPKNLSQIHDPPVLLYIKGEIKKQDELAIAVVGTRKMTSYGREVTEKICSDLAQAGVTIISGLALGIDAVAHRSALKAGGRTIAVLAGGLDRRSIFPPHNLALASEIVAKNQGACVSENHIGTSSLKFMFPVRNRIVSGMSLGVLVVEASEKSGALITAMSALDQNREVFAIPGNILSPQSIGANNLIKMGAKSVTSAQDILEELNIKSIGHQMKAREILPENQEEKVIYEVLNYEPKNSDAIIRNSKLSPDKVLSCLTLMEIKGIIKNIGGGNYIKTH